MTIQSLNNKMIDYLVVTLFTVLPVSFIAGPFIVNTCTIIISCLYLKLYFKHDIKNYKTNLYFHFIIIIIIYLIISSLLGHLPLISITKPIMFINLILFILGISKFISKKEYLLNYIYYIFFGAFLLLFFDIVIEILYGTNLIGNTRISYDRYSSFFGKEQILGSYVVRILPVFLFLNFFLNKNKLYELIIFSLSFFLILISGERTALIMFIMFIFLYFLIIKKKLNFFFILILLASTILTTIFLINPSIKKRLIEQTNKQINFTNKNLNFYSLRHQDHINTAINIFKKNLFFGSGPNTFRYICANKEYTVFNDIIKRNTIFATENGIIQNEGEIIYFDNALFLEKKLLKKNIILKFKNESKKFDIVVPWNSIIFTENFEKISKGDVIAIKKPPYLNGCNTHPHNFVFQILAETGFVGFFLYLIILLNIYITFLKKLKKIYFFPSKKENLFDKASLILLSGIIINFFPLLPTGNIFNSWLISICLLPVGFLYFILKKN